MRKDRNIEPLINNLLKFCEENNIDLDDVAELIKFLKWKNEQEKTVEVQPK
ncbi:MAG: hypothetical protein N3I35_06830 [Clostridia bacterium]|nr:hypothetical protein [Clostridia bacterium]